MQTSNIKVAVRVRPLLQNEQARGIARSETFEVVDNTSVRISSKHEQMKNFKFDQVFDETCDQETVYRRVRMDYLIKQVVAGFHATVFVYGQTGSGKTFTMDGYKYESAKQGGALQPVITKPVELSVPVSEDGLIPRAIKNLFDLVQQRRLQQPSCKITVSVQYIQLYNERIYDLLNKTAQQKLREKNYSGKETGLKLKWNVATDEVTVENVYKFQCENAEDALNFFWKGMKNKIMASHQMNQNSSRSHCILTFTVHQISTDQDTSQIVSKLQLVDLAGSERQSHTNNDANGVSNATLLKEAIDINKSLFTLRQVISALTENSQKQIQNNGRANPIPLQYVPYRESKLTTLLRQSLGGNSFCLMIACVAPIDMYTEENISTLNYAARASQISNVPHVNMDPRLRQIADQKVQISKLQQELRRANDTIKYLTQGGCICKVDGATHQSNGKAPISPENSQQQTSIRKEKAGNSQTPSSALKFPEISNIESLQQSAATSGHTDIIKSQESNRTPQGSSDANQQTHFPQIGTPPTLNADSEGKPKQEMFSMSQSQFSALQNRFRKTTGLVNSSANYNQDRLISSISVIKEVLQSNMQLRDDLLKLSQENEQLNQNNYQFKIENEDLRDRLYLLGEERGKVHIEYMPYIAAGAVEKLCDGINTLQELRESKILIFNHVFSLQKDNRALLRRLKSHEERHKTQKQVQPAEYDLDTSIDKSQVVIRRRPSSFQRQENPDVEEPSQSTIKVVMQMAANHPQTQSQMVSSKTQRYSHPTINETTNSTKLSKRPPLKNNGRSRDDPASISLPTSIQRTSSNVFKNQSNVGQDQAVIMEEDDETVYYNQRHQNEIKAKPSRQQMKFVTQNGIQFKFRKH